MPWGDTMVACRDLGTGENTTESMVEQIRVAKYDVNVGGG